MSAFIPTSSGYLRSVGNTYTSTGKKTYGDPVKIGLSVIRLTEGVQKTSVRADSSGTKSFADEEVEQGRVLVHPRIKPCIEDLMVINGDTFEVQGVRSVYDMHGGIDHYQVELTSWA